MKVIHLSFSDIIGGAARSSYRIHHSLLKAEINSRMWVNKAKTDDQTIEKPTGIIERILTELRSPLISNSLVKILKTKNMIIHSPSVLKSRWIIVWKILIVWIMLMMIHGVLKMENIVMVMMLMIFK